MVGRQTSSRVDEFVKHTHTHRRDARFLLLVHSTTGRPLPFFLGCSGAIQWSVFHRNP